jgi:uncharacterized cupin superfamily protein
VQFPTAWSGSWHPLPQRQVFFFLAGEVEVTASDGEVRRFPAGAVVLVEDGAGKGQCSRTIGTAALATVVQLPDEAE